MTLLSKILVAPSLVMLLSSSLYSLETYSIKTDSLSEAIMKISKIAKLPFAVDKNILKGKKANPIKNIEGLEKALKQVLKGTGLKAVISNNTIVIVKIKAKNKEFSSLEPMTITATTTPTHYLKSMNVSGALGNKSILDTPFSIISVDGDEIRRRGAKTIGQIFANDPSVYTPSASSTTTWWGNSIRGLGASNYYIDDVPIALKWGGDFPTEVIDKVTVLKGLGGFMYGFGSPGGIISYQLKRPKAEDETSLHMTYSNPGRFIEHIDSSFNVGEEVGVRLNIVNEHGKAYNESVADRQTFSLAVDKKFGDNLKWFNTLVYENNTIKSQPFHFYFDDLDVAGVSLPDVTYDYSNINIDNSYYTTYTRILTTGLDWKLNEQWDLQLQLGYSSKKQESNRSFVDLSNSAGDYAGYMYNFVNEDDNYTGQVMLQGNVSSLGIDHNIVLGLVGEMSKHKGGNAYHWENDFNGNLYEEQKFQSTRTADFSLSAATEKIVQTSVFASDTLTFNEHWSAIAGLRFINYDNKDLDNSDGDSSYDNQAVTPTFALIYKPNPSTSLYTSYVESLENVGRVGSWNANEGEVIDPTISKQYELGAKISLDRFGGSLALFRMEKADTREEFRADNTLPYLIQDGLSIYNGVELSAGYQFTNDLRLGMGVTYIDATIKGASNAETEGNVPSAVSKWQSVLTAEYNPGFIESLNLHANVRYSGDRYQSNANILKIPGYTTADLGFSYDFVALDYDMALTGNVNNLFNEKYWAGGIESGMGEKRNFTFSLSTYF